MRHAAEGKALQYAVPNKDVQRAIEAIIDHPANLELRETISELQEQGLWKGFIEIESPWLNWSLGGKWF
jgi:hypothetical protein